MKYLIGLDSSFYSEKAFQFLLKLLKKEDSVDLVSVVPSYYKKSVEKAKKILLNFSKKCEEIGIVSTIFLIHMEDPRAVLCELAEKNHIDMIVVGSRGLGKVSKLLLGSVSSYCIQYATCNVLIVK
jgi:nucleotide-binding universal stress UspA family protein